MDEAEKWGNERAQLKYGEVSMIEKPGRSVRDTS